MRGRIAKVVCSFFGRLSRKGRLMDSQFSFGGVKQLATYLSIGRSGTGKFGGKGVSY